MERIGLVAPASRQGAVHAAEHTAMLLRCRGITVFAEEELRLENSYPLRDYTPVDALITIGGEGTLLRGAKMLNHAPVLGINLGRTGFLTEAEADGLDGAVAALL